MKLSQVELIVEIARAGSISQAAQNLYTSQPNVSKMLKRFEDEVGAQIFERIGTGIRLTPVGRRFVDSAQDIMVQVNKMADIFNYESITVLIELNIASLSTKFVHHVVSALYMKYSQNPIRITYTECDLETQLERISKGLSEIGVVILLQNHLKRIKKMAEAVGIEYFRLGQVESYLGVSKNSVKYPTSVTEVELARLATMPLVSIKPPSLLTPTGWEFARQVFGKNNLETSHREIMTTNTGTMREIVNQIDGFSIIFMNRGIYNKFGYFDDIRLMPLPQDTVQAEFGWLQKANTARTPIANEFVSMLKEYVTED